jgi:hypothetical protein
MRSVASTLLVGSLSVTGLIALPLPAGAQTPPRPRPAAASATVVVKVTDSFGAPLPGIRVTASGPVARS